MADVTELIPALDSSQEIRRLFRAKYGARDVAAYYPKPNVAVDVPLS